jgi:hypothetical protein
LNVFVVGEAIGESVNQTRMAAVAAGTGSHTRFEEQNRASQVPARLIRNGQLATQCAWSFRRVLLPSSSHHNRETALDDLFDVCRSSTGTHIQLDEAADQLSMSYILNYRLHPLRQCIID